MPRPSQIPKLDVATAFEEAVTVEGHALEDCRIFQGFAASQHVAESQNPGVLASKG